MKLKLRGNRSPPTSTPTNSYVSPMMVTPESPTDDAPMASSPTSVTSAGESNVEGKSQSPQTSPTRVLNFDERSTTSDSEASLFQRQLPVGYEEVSSGPPQFFMNNEDTGKQLHNTSEIYQQLAPPASSIAGSSHRSNSIGSRRKNKKSIAPMPTLNEASSDLEDNETGNDGTSRLNHRPLEDDRTNNTSFDSWEAESISLDQAHNPQSAPSTDGLSRSPRRLQPYTPTVTQLWCVDEHRKSCEQIRGLMDTASDLAARGKEEEALRVYKRALPIGRSDVARIKTHIRQVNPHTKFSIELHLYWLEIGVLLAEVRTDQAMLHERIGDRERSISCVEEAVSIYQRQSSFLNRQDPSKSVVLTEKIQELEELVRRRKLSLRKQSSREELHDEIESLRRRVWASSSPEERKDLYTQMTVRANALQSLEISLHGNEDPAVADLYSMLGAFCLEQNDIETAIVHMKEAQRILRKALGTKHPRTGTKLLNLAAVYSNQALRGEADSQQETQVAIEYYQMAIAIFRSSEAVPQLLGSTLNDLAVIHIRRKEFKDATVLLAESLDVYETAAKNDKDCDTWDTAQVWRNLGECHCQSRNFEAGCRALVHALNIQKEGRVLYDKVLTSDEASGARVPPLHLVDDQAIADTLRRLGKAYFGAGNFESALVFYKEACLIHKDQVKKVVHEGKKTNLLSLPARQDQLAQTIFCMGELHDHTGDLDQAAKLYSEALQLRLFSDAHKSTRSNMVHCAMCLNGLGGVHMKRHEYTDAKHVFRDALNYCVAHGVPEGHPIRVMIQTRVNEAEQLAPDDEATDGCTIEELELRAADSIRAGDLDTAVVILSAVMKKRKDLLRQAKANGEAAADVKYDTACTLKTFGEVLAMKGDTASAQRAFKDSLKLFKKSGTSPDEAVVLELCEELHRLLNASK